MTARARYRVSPVKASRRRRFSSRTMAGGAGCRAPATAGTVGSSGPLDPVAVGILACELLDGPEAGDDHRAERFRERIVNGACMDNADLFFHQLRFAVQAFLAATDDLGFRHGPARRLAWRGVDVHLLDRQVPEARSPQ